MLLDIQHLNAGLEDGKQILNDLNLVYDFTAPILPSMMYLVFNTIMSKKSFKVKAEKNDLTQNENAVE